MPCRGFEGGAGNPAIRQKSSQSQQHYCKIASHFGIAGWHDHVALAAWACAGAAFTLKVPLSLAAIPRPAQRMRHPSTLLMVSR
jgi:hypothetical protein